MYYRGAQAAIVVYDITSSVWASASLYNRWFRAIAALVVIDDR
jgi:GTPase SAR1 family protein